jgi:serine/threonine protein kinase
MDSFFKQLDKGLDSIAGKIDKMEKKWNEGGSAGDEGVGDVYSINGSRYRIVKKLAEGGFAFVFLAEQVDTGRPVALKRILVQDDEHMEIIKREINFLKTLSGKEGIIPFLGAASFRKPNRQEVVVLTEFCPRGSVLNLMYQRERNRMTETEILFIFETVCKAVYHMHSLEPPIAHRDLKVENVLVGKNGALYLIDFGSATVVTYDTDKPHIRNIAENDINRNTTLLYRAPEMVDLYRKQLIDEKVDVWALGCMLYKMMYYADPFDGKLGILNARYRAPDFPPYTPKMHDLLKFLLTADPEKRPDICDVLEKLGTSVPRIKRKAAPVKERSASPRRENGNADDAAGKDLFAMLDWQKNDGPSSPATAVQRSGAREARSRSPAAESLVDDFEKKATISNGNDQATDFFAAFDVQRQPSPSPSTPAASGGAAAIDFFSSPSSTSSAAGNDDAWGEFSTFATASAPAPAAGAAPLGVALMGSPLASPTTAHRQPVEKKDILSLYATDPASGAASPASASLYGHPGYAPSPPMSGTYNTMPVGMPMGMVYVMAQPTAVASPMASPLYARAPSPLAGGSTLAPSPYGSGASPMVAHRAPLSGGLTPMSTPPLTPLSTPPLTPMSGRSGPGAMPAAAGGPGAAGDPFADLWKTASK